MEKKKILVTVVCLLTLLSSIVALSATYNYSLICFANQHVQSGYQNVAYDSFMPTRYQAVNMVFDGNSVISTGKYDVGIRLYDSETATLGTIVDYDTIGVTSTSQNLDDMYYYNLNGNTRYKAYIYGYSGVHIIMNKATVNYN